MIDPKKIRYAVELRFGNLWIDNFVANLPKIRSSPSITELVFDFSLRGVIIVGAGPSLDGTLQYFREIPKAWRIIAADAALKPLLMAGRRPDAVFSVDPQPDIARFFAGIDTSGLRLAACSVTSPKALAAWDGEVFFYHQTGVEIETLTRIEGAYPLPGLAVGGSVLTVAWSFARLAGGCSPVVFTGQDLCYDGARTHCAGVDDGVPLDGLARQAQYFQFLGEETGIRGERILNLPAMSYSARWFEERVGSETINASERGIMPGAAQTLRETLYRENIKMINPQTPSATPKTDNPE